MNNTTTKKPWSTKKKLGLLGGIPLAAVATTAAAAAIIAGLASVQGGGSTASFRAEFADAIQVDSSAMTFKPSNDLRVEGGALKLPTTMQFFGGESVAVEASVKTELGRAGYLSGISFPGLPSGWRAEVVSGCGQKVTGVMPTIVKLKITAAPTLEQGASWTLAPDAGVMVTPLSSASATAPAGVTCAPYLVP